MASILQEGIAAAKSGDRSKAFTLLVQATQDATTAEQAWLWLSGVVSQDSERLFCLNNVIRINQDNAAAQRGAAMLRDKGVYPSMPEYPESPQPSSAPKSMPQTAPPPQAPFSSEIPAAPVASASTANLQTASGAASQPQASAPSAPGKTDLNKQDASGLYRYAAAEIARNRSPQAVEKELVKQGTSPELANRIVTETHQAIRKARSAGYKKRMIRGLLWTIGGCAITAGTYIFADKLGGSYFLFWGAIIFGFIDFIIGLWGWIANT